MTVSGCELRNNAAADRAGAIWVDAPLLTVVSSTFRANTARGGGAIFAYAGQLVLHHSTFVDNNDVEGGAYSSCDLLIQNTGWHNPGPPPPPPELYGNIFLTGSVPCASNVMVSVQKEVRPRRARIECPPWHRLD